MTRNSHALNLELFTLPSKLENKSLDEKLLIALLGPFFLFTAQNESSQ
jgi:hypothetical protein